MVRKEEIPAESYNDMPLPGTVPHLDWLNNLPNPETMDPAEFLHVTAAPTTLARQIMRHRSYWPLGNVKFTNSIFLDTNFLDLRDEWTPDRYFSGRIDIYGAFGEKLKTGQELPMPEWEFPDFTDPNPRSHNLLSLSGRPYPNSNVHKDITYNLQIPLTQSLLHDTTRPVVARVETTGAGKLSEGLFAGENGKPEIITFNEFGNSWYRDNEPAAFFRAFKSAAADLHFLVHHQFKNWNSVVFYPKESRSRIQFLGRITNTLRRTA